jgi:hypothetical protein
MMTRPGSLARGIRAVAVAGVASLAALALAASVALAAPDTTLDSAPQAVTNDNTPAFAFSSSEPGSSFECRQQSSGSAATAFAACSSPHELAALPDGLWVFEVRALDQTGTPDDTPATHSFRIDTSPPDTAILSGPAGPTSNTTPQFAYSSTEEGAFECRHHRIGEPPPAYAQCPSGSRTLGPLAQGSYVFEVAAIDAAGNRDGTPASQPFRVDTTPPDTAITGGPGDTTAANAAFFFSAEEGATFWCRLDGGGWGPCDSPRVYSGLDLGPHRFEVRGIDQAGNVEPTPAGHTWQVLRPGAVIPAVVKQATALATEVVQMRRALARLHLRTLARRKAITLKTFDAMTPGVVEVRVRTRRPPRRQRRPRWITLLTGKREIPRPGRHIIRAVVTKKGRRLARQRRPLPVELRLSFTDSAGRSLWATAEMTMKRGPSRRRSDSRD